MVGRLGVSETVAEMVGVVVLEDESDIAEVMVPARSVVTGAL